MSGKVENQVLYKLFLGFQLDLPLKKELNESLSWRQAIISWQNLENTGLKTVFFHHKEFLGKYAPENAIPLQQLRQIENEMKALITPHCSRVNLEHYKLYLFAQILIL